LGTDISYLSYTQIYVTDDSFGTPTVIANFTVKTNTTANFVGDIFGSDGFIYMGVG